MSNITDTGYIYIDPYKHVCMSLYFNKMLLNILISISNNKYLKTDALLIDK